MHTFTPACRRVRSLVAWIAVVAASLALVACGPGGGEGRAGADAGEAEWNFLFIHWTGGFARIDTRSGAVWTVPTNGDGGWTARGGPRDLRGEPAEPGRFALGRIPRNQKSVRLGAAARDGVLLLTDRSLGRAWVLLGEEDTRWLEIPDPGRASGSGTPAPAEEQAQSGTPAGSAGTGSTQADAESYPVLSSDQLDPSPEAQQELVETLSAARSKSDLPYEMRVWSIQQLTGVDPDLAVPELLKILDEDEDPVMVAEAVRALGEIGRASTLPRIVALSKHPDERVRSAVGEVVTKVE